MLMAKNKNLTVEPQLRLEADGNDFISIRCFLHFVIEFQVEKLIIDTCRLCADKIYDCQFNSTYGHRSSVCVR